jgi:hypothetical protein
VFSTFPYSVSRYSTTPGEVFGRGLATQCMADVIKLNGYSDDVSVAVKLKFSTLSTRFTIP